MAVTFFEEHAPLRREGSPRHQLTARAPPLIGCRQRATCRRTPAKGSASSTDTTYWNLKRCKNLCALLVGGRPCWSAGAECYRRYQNCYPIRWDALGKRTIETAHVVDLNQMPAAAWCRQRWVTWANRLIALRTARSQPYFGNPPCWLRFGQFLPKPWASTR